MIQIFLSFLFFQRDQDSFNLLVLNLTYFLVSYIFIILKDHFIN